MNDYGTLSNWFAAIVHISVAAAGQYHRVFPLLLLFPGLYEIFNF
jgi:hypothetical protein